MRRVALPKDDDIRRLQIAVENAAFVRGLQSVGNLARQPNRLVSGDGTAQRFSLEIFKDEVIGTHLVDLADVWMVDRGDGARFALEPAVVLREHPLDPDGAIQSSVVRVGDLAHTSRADERFDRVWAEPRAGSQEHAVSADFIPRDRPLTPPGPS